MRLLLAPFAVYVQEGLVAGRVQWAFCAGRSLSHAHHLAGLTGSCGQATQLAGSAWRLAAHACSAPPCRTRNTARSGMPAPSLCSRQSSAQHSKRRASLPTGELSPCPRSCACPTCKRTPRRCQTPRGSFFVRIVPAHGACSPGNPCDRPGTAGCLHGGRCNAHAPVAVGVIKRAAVDGDEAVQRHLWMKPSSHHQGPAHDVLVPGVLDSTGQAHVAEVVPGRAVCLHADKSCGSSASPPYFSFFGVLRLQHAGHVSVQRSSSSRRW